MTEETGVIMVTMNYVPGKKITKVIGTVWGITVRSRGIDCTNCCPINATTIYRMPRPIPLMA